MPDTEKNLWILSEERPKVEAIEQILKLVVGEEQKIDNIRPLFQNKKFQFKYEIQSTGKHFSQIILELVSGTSSFVDFLIFQQKESPEPEKEEQPTHIIEETKTTSKESRNTSVGQRLSKFVFTEFFPKLFKNSEKVMLWNTRTETQKNPPDTFVDGIKRLRTLDVKILGLEKTGIDLNEKKYQKYESIEDLIKELDNKRLPPKGNTPVKITKKENKIEISGKLKNGNNWHDPNMGNLSSLVLILRKFGWKHDIIITKHEITQEKLNRARGNKFVKIANRFNVKLDGRKLPKPDIDEYYWKKGGSKEKIGSIFLHMLIDYYKKQKIIYENHGSSEQGYFITKIGEYLQIGKQEAKPDLIILDEKNKEIFILEAEFSKNILNGIKQLDGFSTIEEEYCKKYYPGYKYKRFVILYGDESSNAKEVIFTLKTDGTIICSKNCPQIIKDAVEKIQNS